MISRAAPLALVLSALISVGGIAQEVPETGLPSAPKTIKVDTEMVLLNAIVVDKKGRPVNDLLAGDFEVYDKKLLQEIAYFGQGSLPSSYMLILDMHAGCCNNMHVPMLHGVAKAIGSLAPDDKVAVMIVNEERELVVDFTKDKKRASQALSDLAASGRPWGLTQGSTMNQAMVDSIRSLSQAAGEGERRFLILVGPRCTGAWLFRFKGPSRSKVLRLLYESGIVVSRLIIDDRFNKAVVQLGRYHPYLFALRKFSGAAELSKYVKRTGGVIATASKHKTGEALSGLLDGINLAYAIGYYPNGLKRDGSFHRIRLKQSDASKKSRGKMALKTRHGYYATPPGQPSPEEVGEVLQAGSGIPPAKK